LPNAQGLVTILAELRTVKLRNVAVNRQDYKVHMTGRVAAGPEQNCFAASFGVLNL
jgi:hypothetical protein